MNFVQKTIKDILSERTEIRKTKLETKEFDEKSLILNELVSLAKKLEQDTKQQMVYRT